MFKSIIVMVVAMFAGCVVALSSKNVIKLQGQEATLDFKDWSFPKLTTPASLNEKEYRKYGCRGDIICMIKQVNKDLAKQDWPEMKATITNPVKILDAIQRLEKDIVFAFFENKFPEMSAGEREGVWSII